MLIKSALNNITKTDNQVCSLSSRYAVINTPRGEAGMGGPVEGVTLSSLRLSEQMDSFRQPNTQLQFLVSIAGLPQGRVYIVHKNKTIVGYVTFHLPDTYSRWYHHPRVIEMGGIEIARDWRSCHVGSDLLKFIFSDPFWEDYIVFGLECFRHWDLSSSHLSVWEYRKMVDKLVRQVHFEPSFTMMYDVLEHPANALTTRCGARVSRDDWGLFKKIAASSVKN